MGESILTRDDIIQKTGSGINCSQCVFGEYAEVFGFDQEDFYRIGSAFGGGMYRGDTCGAVTGALMVLGLAYSDDKPLLQQKTEEFQKQFSSVCGSTICRDLLHYDFSVKGQFELARSSGIIAQKCPGFIEQAFSVLDDLLQDYFDTL